MKETGGFDSDIVEEVEDILYRLGQSEWKMKTESIYRCELQNENIFHIYINDKNTQSLDLGGHNETELITL